MAAHLALVEGGRTTLLAKTRKKATVRGRQLKTYRFVDKDPVIDLIRTAIQDQYGSSDAAVRRGIKEVAARAGCAPSTPVDWIFGPTMRPKFATLEAVARAMDLTFKLVRRR